MVDERWKRIPQLWLWTLAGAAFVGVFVFVFAVAPSLIIGPPPKGLSAADELKARNDVRTTLVQALAGLAVAGGLVVTYRTYRQNRAEQDRTYERELYAKAVEQLGHEKAPVRLGALYSLERLAEDRPERRQVIVNVICAYLRMPFSPTAPREPDGKIAKDLAKRTETEARINEIGSAWQQERQVRLTAQRILAEHLRDDRAEDKRSADHPGARFWPDIHLNLADATLIDFNLANGVIAGADFGRATFSGTAEFGRATFSSDAGFGRATFSSGTGFGGATFSGTAEFGRATFSGTAWFRGATFSSTAGFGEATFSSTAGFGEATFSSDAWFDKATFSSDAGFSWATFSSGAWFGEATFSDAATFDVATFSDTARFDKATFSSGAWFHEATFSSTAAFDKATFSSTAAFDKATFSGTAWFDGATFSGGENSLSFDWSVVTRPDAQHFWPTGWCLGPDGNGGYTVVRAKV
jgi:uncharacterized protein YjbI with pentapeptide repeats